MSDQKSSPKAEKQGKKIRRSRPWHRILGVFAALPLVWLLLTGAVLNHTVDWNLDQTELDHPWILRAYGMTPSGTPQGIMVGEHQVAEWDGQLFFNAIPLEVSGSLIGAVADGQDGGIAVITSEAVLRLDAASEVVELLDEVSLPSTPLDGVAVRDGKPLLKNAAGWHEVDQDWLEFTVAEEAPFAKQALATVENEEAKQKLSEAWTRGGLPASRVVLDLHSGRFLGSFGKYFFDFVAICTLWLCVTGLILFFRKAQRKR